METFLAELSDHYCNVELLTGIDASGNRVYGVRIRPYGKGSDTDTMVLAGAPTLAKAMEDAHAKAKAGRFEQLDFRKRPWAVGTQGTAWGVDRRPQFDQESATIRAKRRWTAVDGDST